MREELAHLAPQKLDDNLLLRWGRPEDADALAEFNIRIHSDDPARPDQWLGDWTRDLMSGHHPTTSPVDFTIVEDLNTGAIVSSLVLISQTWLYEDIPFGVGRPELVATDEAYRRRGLIRIQMKVAHELSAAKGHLVQAITGIPWFYRLFGYEMALNLGGGRELFWTRPGNDKPLDKEMYQIRPATVDDIPILQDLYPIHGARSLITRQRTEAIWRYELAAAHPSSIGFLHAHIIADEHGRTVAYAAFNQHRAAFHVNEMGVIPGHSWRSVALFLVRELKRRADELNKECEKPISQISFPVNDNHQLIDALNGQLEKLRNPYAWYIRVPDLHGFVSYIRPVLERRMETSVVAGHSGTLRLNFYMDTLTMKFEDGALVETGRYEPKHVEDADAMLPGLTFLQLLFGYRSLEELDRAFGDCYATNAEAVVLLNTLFPKRPSYIWGLN